MKQFIKCPECGSVEIGIVDTTTIPWNTLIHWCSKCKYCIMESEWEPLKGLSIKQPWAWLIVNGYKPLENRDTLKNFRGPFLVHASLQYDFEWRDKLPQMKHRKVCEIDKILSVNFKLMKIGGIIGHATITDSIIKSDSPWFSGKYGLVIENPKPLDFTPCKGKLSFFNPEII